jgi:hypothetical protein
MANNLNKQSGYAGLIAILIVVVIIVFIMIKEYQQVGIIQPEVNPSNNVASSTVYVSPIDQAKNVKAMVEQRYRDLPVQ